MSSLFARLLVISCSIISTFANAFPHYVSIQKRTCASQDPDDNLRAKHNYLQNNEHLDNSLWNSSMVQNRVARHYRNPRDLKITNLDTPYAIDKRQAIEPLYTVDTYFHVVADRSNSDPGTPHYVTDRMISDQLAYLNNAYRSSGVAYNLLGTTRTTNDTWASNGDDLAMKKALRRGTYSTLNVYYQTQLQSNGGNGIPTGSTLLGFCSLPTAGVTKNTSPSAYVLDGCNILSGTLPGGFEADYNIGGTSTHEIGHWNGLLHPFQDYTCDSNNFGDYVADTPQESVATAGCPTQKDSCPNSGVPAGTYDGSQSTVNPYGPSGFSGPDPVHNFMDYSQDSCYEGFTAGQSARMLNLWVIYRMGL